MAAIVITKLDRPIYVGDWHDKPLRWAVNGPAAERQIFSTRQEARRYASLRRQYDYREAGRRYVFED